MISRQTHTIETMRFTVHVTQADIDEGECRLASRCMHKLAVSRVLLSMDEHLNDATIRVRVDAGHIKFNYGGARWIADMPKIASNALKNWDRWGMERNKCKRNRKPLPPCPVKPHAYKIVARRVSTIQRQAPERQQQVNAARRKRVAEGRPDKPHNPRMTLRKRIVGFA